MTITEIRRLLTKKELDQVTERAFRHGAFTVENVRKANGKKEVAIRYAKDGERETLVL
jgi:hypothetical protein